MLVEITKIPNAENSAIQLHPSDNVAIARVPLAAAAELRIGGHEVITRDAIPAGHKVALRDIAKANEIWPNETWGIALNSTTKRSQCHIHVHIGKLMAGIVDENFVVVSGPAEIPVPPDGDGVWIHPLNGRLHVHAGVTDGELNLER